MTELAEAHTASCLRQDATDATAAQPLLHPLSLSVSSACQTLDSARSTFYRYRHYDPFVDPNVELRSRIQQLGKSSRWH